MFLATVANMLYQIGSRINGTVMATHAMMLDEQIQHKKSRLGPLLVAVLVIGLVVCGSAHLYYGYNNSLTVDGYPTFGWGSLRFSGAASSIMEWQRQGELSKPVYSEIKHFSIGAGIASVLMWLCMHFPSWPLHPVGLIMLFSLYGELCWASMFIGWLIKTLLVRYGGSAMYRKAKPVFLGFIFGEVFAAIFWCAVPVILTLLNKPYLRLGVR